MSSLIKMGVVGRPHGIKGELGVDWFADHIPGSGSRIFIGEDNPAPFIVRGVRRHKDRLLLTLEGVNDRNHADALKGSSVLVDRSALPPTDSDEALVADLLNSSVFLPDGSLLGTLDHIEYPANKMIWAIKSVDGAELLFPAEPEFIDSLDAATHRIVISPPEGLLDIYRA